ncbi:putative LOB domain-containing protein [Melia azedarach]|uniref:LOB domain-containing protein n=1 Tax=Melia azedarach TaxID=155640 RepID=A0ACC1XBH1_MELAZ|nr:putative LOB domain-containing protein [Melia azedarach]
MSREFGGGSSSQACASCKHQRKKCDENCELAPYFPASKYREFQNAHKLFGVSNIQKLINSVEPHQRQAAAESILIEGNIRYRDPVHGCLGIVRNLKSQIALHEEELNAVNQQLAFFRERVKQQQLENFLNSSSVAPSVFDNYEAGGFNSLRAPPNLPNIGDMKIGERMYNHQSTMEESAGVQPFDIQAAIDQILNPYQTDQHALSSLAQEPGYSKEETRASGKQPSESVSDKEAAESGDVSSLKGKKHTGH